MAPRPPRSRQAATTASVMAATMRPIQGKCLAHEQVGGTRTPAENARKPDAKALVLPAPALPLNAYRNIPAGILAKLRAAAPGNKAGIGGYFQRVGAGLQRLTTFKASTACHPKFGFHGRVVGIAARIFPDAMAKRFGEALDTARR